MIDSPISRHHSPAGPAPPVLPPAANGYRRSLYPGRGVSVYCDRHPPNEWGEHTHDQEQVSALLDDAECLIKRKTPDGNWHEITVQGPAVWVMPAGTPHALIYPKEADMVTLFVERVFVWEILARGTTEFTVLPLAWLSSRDALIGQLTNAFRRLCRKQEMANPLYVESIGTVLGAHVLQALFCSEDEIDRRGGLPDEALQRVTCYIDAHIGDELELLVLGQAAGFSASHFGRLFKKSLGLTPHDYVMRRRVAKAEELLRATDKKEVEIAGLCGFSDDTLMARWFRRVLGCRPKDFRGRGIK
jgi:AraC family transcriptional regulator